MTGTLLPSLDGLRPNPDWAKLPLFDRKGLKRMPFSALAESINERVEPSDAAEEIYVGLEHLDSQNLHIRRWGKGSDVIGTKLRFRKGDIIFGRRRAYQRKLAVAEFDGICSAHAMVVRAKPDMVLPEFLPFLMMSDRFMNRAVEISVGSLSPTINWTTLKLEEFDIPPLDQQHRIAEILWTVDETVHSFDKLHKHLGVSRSAFLAETFGIEGRWPCLEADKFCLAVTDGTHDSPKPSTAGFPLVTSRHLTQGGIDFSNCYSISEADFLHIAKRSRVDQFDILLGMIGTIGKPLLVEDPEPRFAIKNIALFKFGGDPAKAKWMLAYLQSMAFNQTVAKQSTGNAQKFLSLGLLRSLPIPNPDSASRKSVLAALEKLDETVDFCRLSLEAVKKVLLIFINGL